MDTPVISSIGIDNSDAGLIPRTEVHTFTSSFTRHMYIHNWYLCVCSVEYCQLTNYRFGRSWLLKNLNFLVDGLQINFLYILPALIRESLRCYRKVKNKRLFLTSWLLGICCHLLEPGREVHETQANAQNCRQFERGALHFRRFKSPAAETSKKVNTSYFSLEGDQVFAAHNKASWKTYKESIFLY